MAIYQINEVKAQQQGDANSTGVRNYLRILQLLSNDALDDSQVALFAVLDYLGTPPGSIFVAIYHCGNSIDTGAYLTKITVRQDTSKKGEFVNWEARLEYSSQLDQQPDNPLLRPTIINGSFQMYQKPVERDIYGQPIVNTAKQRLEGAQIDDARPHVTMTRNEITYEWAYFALFYVNFVNLLPFYGAAPGQVKCCNVGGQGPNTENGVTYYTVTYEFQMRIEGWQPVYMSTGRKDVNGKPLTDANGNQLDEPGFLDKNGNQVPWPVVPANVATVNPTTYYFTDFNTLGLP